MNKEDAIKLIRKYECNKEHYEACEMAIKALEKHTEERTETHARDCISRQAVLDTIGNVPDHGDGMVWEALSHAQRDVALLPPVTPQPKIGHWILKHRTHNAVKHYTGQDEMGETHTISVLERYEVDEPYCSECGKLAGDTSQDYCCACGANMKEVNADADSN